MTDERSTNRIQIESLEGLPPNAASDGSLALVQGRADSASTVELSQLDRHFETIYFVENVDAIDFSSIDDITKVSKFAASGFGLDTEHAIAIADHLTELKVLYLSNNRIAAAGLRAIAEIESLTSLYVANNGVGRGVAALAELWQLQRLDLSHNSLGAKKVLPLGELGNLEHLRVDACHIYWKNLHVLSQLPKLQTLSISDNNLGDDGAELLGELSTLTSLTIDGNNLTERGVAALRQLRNITTLNLD